MAKKIMDLKLLGEVYFGIPKISVPAGTIKGKGKKLDGTVEVELLPGVKDIPYLVWITDNDCYLYPTEKQLLGTALKTGRRAQRCQPYHTGGGYFPVSSDITEKWERLEMA